MITADILNSTKLVVWDLDDTFWQGTLSEGGIRFSLRMLRVLVRLSRHGVIHSIASHNEEVAARAILKTYGAWDFFVFPEIGWTTKGDMVRRIIANARLRPENTVYLDDKMRIRAAVSGAIPNLLATATADELARIFEPWERARNPTDPKLHRLKQYKLLERRQTSEQHFVATGEGDARDFLAASDIHCTICAISEDMEERVLELVLRTNQLNFTQQRLYSDDLRSLLRDEDVQCRAIMVRDKFGDYGLCGFYALKCHQRPTLLHFLFSCRILQMGVEAAIYRQLGCPDVDTALDQVDAIERVKQEALETDWVRIEHIDTPWREPEQRRTSSHRNMSPRLHLTMVGPCDIRTISHGLDALCHGHVNMQFRTMTVNDDGRVIRHFGHHAFLRLAANGSLHNRHMAALSTLPWFDRELLHLNDRHKSEPHVVVISAVRNAQCADYLHESGEFSVPMEYFRTGGLDFTAAGNRELAASFVKAFHHACPADFIEWFGRRFSFVGPVSAEQYERSLQILLDVLPMTTRIVMLNVLDVSEMSVTGVPVTSQCAYLCDMWRHQHRAVNRAIQNIRARNPSRLKIIDVNRHVSSASDIATVAAPRGPWAEWFGRFDRYYHYKRHVFLRMRDDLLRALREWNLLDNGDRFTESLAALQTEQKDGSRDS